MKQIRITIFMSLITIFTGCERVIEMDLNEANPVLVIEADLSSPDGLLTVMVSRTRSYFGADTLEKVVGANVVLENKSGKQEQVPEVSEGVYQLAQIQTGPGDEFRLSVEVDGISYTALTSVKPPVDIDTIEYNYYPGDDFFRPGYRFNVAFHDPAEQKNYYRIRVYRNGYIFNRPTDLVVFDDADLDGTLITVRLHSQYYLEKGETALIELMTIDRSAWEYFTSLSEVINVAPGSPAPANPESNFTNGALGYFYAWSYTREMVMISK